MYYPEKCIGCGECDKGCFSGAKVVCGKEMDADEIMDVILQDKDYYGSDGGVTFSGGEPLSQPQILKEIIKRCKSLGINTCIETSLCIFDKEILSLLDYVIADFKIYDTFKHKQYVGIFNDIIKQNFKLLDEIGVPFEVHTPVITGVNDNIEEITSISEFIKQFKNIKAYKLLPYHSLGVPKLCALGKEIIKFEIPSDEKMEELFNYANIR